MAADRVPRSASLSEDSDSEEEEFEEGDEQDAADNVNRKMMSNDTESDSSDEKEEGEEEDEVEDESEEDEKSVSSPVRRGLDNGSDDDSGNTVPSPSPSDFVVKVNSQGKKRAAEIEQVKLKKSKKEKKTKGEKENDVASVVVVEDIGVAEDKTKRLSGQRIWGPEDELTIVKGMMDYKKEKGVDFNSNLDAFYQFIKGHLNAVVDKSQLVNKIRKLKEKFRDNAAKEGNCKELVFLKSHEAEVYEYSKKVWGGKSKAVACSKLKSNKEKEVVADAPVMDNVFALPVPDLELSKKEVNGGNLKSPSQVTKSVKNSKVAEKMEFMNVDVEMKDSVIPMPLMVEGLMFEKGLEFVEKSKVDALNEKWNKYQMDAAGLYMRRVDLIKEQTELILGAMKSNR